MEKNMTTSYMGFDCAEKENWYLSCLSEKPNSKVKVRFADGREYIYKSSCAIKNGDVAMIGRGCNTSFEMGEVVGVNVAGGGKGYMSNAQYVFATNPSQDEIKKMGGKIYDYQDVSTVASKVIPNPIQCEVNIPKVDIEIKNLLFAFCILAHEKLATPVAIKKAKACLGKSKFLCSELFGNYIDDRFNRCSGPVLALEFSGYYPEWEKKISELSLYTKKVETLRLDEESIRFERCSDTLENLIREDEEFARFYNELIFRSALSIVIRGGFVNLLRAALRVQMPIGAFYCDLIDLAKTVDSKHCLALLEEHKAEYI